MNVEERFRVQSLLRAQVLFANLEPSPVLIKALSPLSASAPPTSSPPTPSPAGTWSPGPCTSRFPESGDSSVVAQNSSSRGRCEHSSNWVAGVGEAEGQETIPRRLSHPPHVTSLRVTHPSFGLRFSCQLHETSTLTAPGVIKPEELNLLEFSFLLVSFKPFLEADLCPRPVSPCGSGPFPKSLNTKFFARSRALGIQDSENHANQGPAF